MTTPGMAPALSAAVEGQAAPARRDPKLRHHNRNTLLIAASYAVDGVALLMFHLAGTIGWVPVVAYTGAGLAGCAVIFALTASGWTQRFKDPGIASTHTVVSHVVQFAAMALFPQVNFMFVLILFIVYTTQALWMSVRGSVIAWVEVSVGTAVVLLLMGDGIHIPHATLAEQLISQAFFVLTLARCMLIGSFNSNMTALLKKRGQELASLTTRVDQLAHSDELTGVYNRRSLLNALRDEILISERQKTPVSVALMDLDRFKAVNDTLGHLAGDKTLRIFADTLSRQTRKSDRFGRYGGEEFLLVMTGTDASAAQVPMQRMREALKDADWREVQPGFSLTFSCGIACREPGESVESLLNRADEALYKAKDAGRNCTRLA